jgi:uncharacterized repeat protein (TIGR01451 family)
MTSQANGFRALPILVALTLNLVIGPLAPMTIQAADHGLNILKRQVDANGDPTSEPIAAGDTAYFEVIVWNAGPQAVQQVTLHDDLPSDMSWSVALVDADADDACALASGAGPGLPESWSADCSFGELPPTSMEDGKHLIFSGQTDIEDCGVRDNSARAAADGVDPIEATASVTVVCPAATLLLDKEASFHEVHLVFDADGDLLSATPEQVTWTLTYTLPGDPVSGAVISDPLPEFLTFVSASDGGSLANGVITWNLGSLTQGGSVSFVTTVDPGAPEGRTIMNVASIDSNETEPNDGRDWVLVTAESELAGHPTPAPPSLPNTALAAPGPHGQPMPVDLMLLVFLGSLGTLVLAGARAPHGHR